MRANFGRATAASFSTCMCAANVPVALFAIVFIHGTLVVDGVKKPTPTFAHALNGTPDETMQNITAYIGDTVQFRCRIENAGKLKVAFFRDGVPPMLIAYDTSVFRRSDKYELKTGSGDWVLRIRNAQEQDQGGYTCQVNTNPVLAKTAYLTLKIPPSIGSEQSSPAAVEVREGHNITLECHARGNPAPTIVWRRADRQIIRYNGANGYGNSVHRSPQLSLQRVNRKHTGEYVCVASNGIPPDETWTIKLRVLFEPLVTPQTAFADAHLHAPEARIGCTVEGWPRPDIVWLLNGEELHDHSKYAIEESVADRYKSVHLLVIKELGREQFGTYRCMARNDYGSHYGDIRLIESPPLENDPIGRSIEETTTTTATNISSAQQHEYAEDDDEDVWESNEEEEEEEIDGDEHNARTSEKQHDDDEEDDRSDEYVDLVHKNRMNAEGQQQQRQLPSTNNNNELRRSVAGTIFSSAGGDENELFAAATSSRRNNNKNQQRTSSGSGGGGGTTYFYPSQQFTASSAAAAAAAAASVGAAQLLVCFVVCLCFSSHTLFSSSHFHCSKFRKLDR